MKTCHDCGEDNPAKFQTPRSVRCIICDGAQQKDLRRNPSGPDLHKAAHWRDEWIRRAWV